MQADRSGLKWGGGRAGVGRVVGKTATAKLTICFHTNQIKMFLAKN